jgi:hypothetical protein
MCGVGPKNTVLERVWYLKISASVPADASAPGLIYRLNTTTADGVTRRTEITFAPASASDASAEPGVWIGHAPHDEALSHARITLHALAAAPGGAGGVPGPVPVVMTVHAGARVRQVHVITPAFPPSADSPAESPLPAGSSPGPGPVCLTVSYYDAAGSLVLTESGALLRCEPGAAVDFPVSEYSGSGSADASAGFRSALMPEGHAVIEDVTGSDA